MAWASQVQQDATRQHQLAGAEAVVPPATAWGSEGEGYGLAPHQAAVVLWALQYFKWVPRSAGFVQAAAAVLSASNQDLAQQVATR